MYPVMGETVITQSVDKTPSDLKPESMNRLANFTMMGLKLILVLLIVGAILLTFGRIISYRKRKARRAARYRSSKNGRL
jgi:flagellar biogenesis protein FliO